jgi:hypothetical protein
MNRPLLAVLGTALFAGCHTEPAALTRADSAAVYVNQERYSPSAWTAGDSLSPQLRGFAALDDVPDKRAVALPTITSNMVIRTAEASIEVDSLEPAIRQLNQLATRLGGFVAGSGIESGKNQLRRSFMELKIPSARFDEGKTGLAPIGKLESLKVDAQDVGEEFVDVNARMENSRRLERRLLDLLATRTGKLKDVLDVEQSLARVREEIERYEGRIRYLQAHTAMSTLSVTIHEPIPVIGTAGKSVMGEAFTQAWRNFVMLLAFVVQSLGVVLPLAVVAITGWMLTKRLRLAKQRAA